MKKPQETVQPRGARMAASRQRSVAPKNAAISNPLDEIRALRLDVAELKRQLEAEQSMVAAAPLPDNLRPWLKIAATVGVTFALGKMMQILRLPPAAAVAVPMISAEVNRRFL